MPGNSLTGGQQRICGSQGMEGRTTYPALQSSRTEDMIIKITSVYTPSPRNKR